MQKIFWRIAAGLCALCSSAARGGISAPVVRAEENGYAQSDAMEDLAGAVIGGKPFAEEDYPFDERGSPQVIALSEYGYSCYADNLKDYGLYVYVYNPQGTAFDTDTGRNRIGLAYAGKGNWEKYGLRFLNASARAGYEGLFYKFGICLTDEEREDILNSVLQHSRVYEISGIELSAGGKVTEYAAAMRYTYSGYASGYGPATAEESSLVCTADGFGKTLNLDVHTAYYRPEGTNGKSDYTQDSLHSAYFSIPKTLAEEYGGMSKVHATWLDALLAPVLVTGNRAAYDAIEPCLGEEVGRGADGPEYAYLGGAEYGATGGFGDTGWSGAYGYRFPEAWMTLGGDGVRNSVDRAVSPLYWLFYAGEGKDSADGFVLSSSEIEARLVGLTEKYGGELVNGRYSRVLFDRVAEEFTTIDLAAEFEYDLRNEVIGSSWWDKLWGITYDKSAAFDGIKAIYEVKDGDFLYAGGELDAEATGDKLYISAREVGAFKAFYEANKAENIIYLFRYQVSDYISAEASLFEPETFGNAWKRTDTNGYFMQETVNLDFDVIDVTLTKDGAPTVIPAVSDPVDNIPEGTPPVHTTDDENMDWRTLLGLFLGAMLLIVLLPFIAWLAPYLVKGAVWVLLLPFRGIAAIVRSLKRRKDG